LKSEPGSVQKRDDHPRNSGQLVPDGTHLVDAEHHGYAHRAVCSRHVIDGSRVKTKNLPIQEQECAERLVLSRRADLPFHREIREIPANLDTAHL
jgi:hypothetical protein